MLQLQNSSHNTFVDVFKKSILISSLSMVVTTMTHAQKFVEGKHYKTVENPTKIDTNRIIVREFFWYGCSHCYGLHPHAAKWKKNRPKDVAFFYTPAPFNAMWVNSAKGFYAAQSLGVAYKTHDALFKEIQENNNELFDQSSLANFYSKYGANKQEFNSLFQSMSVNNKVSKAFEAVKKYKITGVPVLVVHGKYVVQGSDAETFKIVDFLVNKVRKEENIGK